MTFFCQRVKEGAFGGTPFRDIYSSVNGKWCRKLWKEYNDLRVDSKYYCSNCYDVRVNKYDVKCRKSLRTWESEVWNKFVDPYG